MKILRAYWPLLFLLTIFLVIVLTTLGRDLLTDWDECLYSQYAVGMKHTGNFLTNHWNGLPTLEKPPLNGLILQIPLLFGRSEFLLRLPSVFFSTLLLIALYHFAKKHFSQNVALLSTLLLLTSEVMMRYMIRVNTDIVYTLFVFMGFYSWVESRKKSFWSILAGVFFGLAVMMKGFGVLPFLIALLASLIVRTEKDKIKKFIYVIGAFAIVILPWHLYEYLVYSEKFITVYFYENVIQRARYPLDFHFEGRLFYVKLITRELFPWICVILFLPFSYLMRIKQFTSLKKIMAEVRREELLSMILLMIVIPLIMITHVKTRIAWYAMPLIPFVVLLIGKNIELITKRLKIRWLIYLIIILIAADALRLVYAETRFFQKERSIDVRHAVFLEAKKQSADKIDYLVQFSERQGRNALSKNLYTSTTWIFGGNPCAHYYSGKIVEYFYSVPEFQKRVKQGDGLYVIENGDLGTIKDKKITILYENTDFTMFKN